MPAEVEEEKEISVPKALEALGLALSSSALNPSTLDPAVSALLWPSEKDLKVSSRLKEPDSKLLSAVSSARTSLANRVSGLAMIRVVRDLSVAVASKVTSMHRDDLQ